MVVNMAMKNDFKRPCLEALEYISHFGTKVPSSSKSFQMASQAQEY